jgi:hypothetical protein
VEEDNDTSGEEDNTEEDEEYYDEEDGEDDEEEEVDLDIDPTDMIETEKWEKSLHPEEKHFMQSMSDIEKKIINKTDNFFKRKKNKYADEDFKWWKFDDENTYFCVTTKRKNTYKKGE